MTFLHASHLLDKPISSRHRWAVDYIMHWSFQHCGSCRLSIRKDQQRISVMNGLVPEKKLRIVPKIPQLLWMRKRIFCEDFIKAVARSTSQ